MSEQETVFAEGAYFDRPHENAPDFIKGNLSFQADRFIEFLQKHKDDKGYVRLDLKTSKEGKLYMSLNQWKKPEAAEIKEEDQPF